ncbi:Bidirectional sugar transporter SWEET6b [Hibiscus syriacus]|uniref:Bidirectional sugar transporter SWEET6b n=1 Tax=Hibiscus syriacus TaxID=106335 RepID=A0A6A2X411_HIBSY|nr:Bidirectional sugar transporter SWEET6b [Hibiscus syriacus]
MNCMLWILYGMPMVHPGSTLVVTINSIGLGMELIYLTIFFLYSTNKPRIANGLGALSGAIQLILYACYFKSTPKDDDENDDVKPSEVELSGNNGSTV